MCLGHKAFGLTEAVTDFAIVGLGLNEASFVIVAVLDEVIAQVSDLRKLLLCGADSMNSCGQTLVGGFQLLNMLLGLDGLVYAIFADGGQNLACDPVLEGFGLRHLAAQDQAVQAGLVDDEYILLAAGGVTFRYTLVLGVDVVGQRFARILVAECGCNVGANQPRLAVEFDVAHPPELGVGEDL